jgi:hypothetical protein
MMCGFRFGFWSGILRHYFWPVKVTIIYNKNKQTPWPEFASDLY